MTGLKNFQFLDTSIITVDFIIYMCFGATVIISYATPFFLLPRKFLDIIIYIAQYIILTGPFLFKEYASFIGISASEGRLIFDFLMRHIKKHSEPLFLLNNS